jgi:hypothetical protein
LGKENIANQQSEEQIQAAIRRFSENNNLTLTTAERIVRGPKVNSDNPILKIEQQMRYT